MNNSRLAIENVSLSEDSEDRKPILQEKEGEQITIINAIEEVRSSDSWSTLKVKIFDGLVETLNRGIQEEARKETPDTLKLNRLAGQLKWAEKYADLDKLAQVFRLELTNIRKQLYGKE